MQRCPNCAAKYDVAIFVSGQKVRCRRCGIRFTVARDDSKPPASPEVDPLAPVATRTLEGEAVHPRHAAPPPPPRQTHRPGRAAQGDLVQGAELNGFVIESVLGRGAMGTVYRGRQKSLDRPVAVKVMSSELAQQQEFVLRFRREAAALATLSHPHVVAIIDQGNVDSYWYLVMEFIDGPTLRKLISQRSLRIAQAFDLALQVGRGLDYAHGRAVVHRDLKPENVLLADAGREGPVAKICDFGLADLLYSDRSFANLTGSRISMGTVNYMAPEQRQDAGKVDQRADVYSYGVMVYEMLTGTLPIGRVEEPSKKSKLIDRRIDGPLLAALEADPRRRPPQVRDLVQALSAHRP